MNPKINIMNYLVSVIVPCYNAELYISQTIESVLNQTYSNLELLVINDCSSDCSKDIILKFVNRDSRVKYYETTSPSGSPALPRNIGLDNAKGHFVSFLDSDDLWLSDKLKKQIEFFKNTKYKFIFSNCEKMSFDGKISNRFVIEPKEITYNSLLKKCQIPSPSVMIERSIIGSTRFKNTQKEDYIFWMDILKKGYTAHNCGEVLTRYRVLPQSRSANKFAMVRSQWYVLRNTQHIDFFRSLYYLSHYIVYAVKKYLT